MRLKREIEFEAINKSKRMMSGYKWKLFCLQCRFFGWAVLTIPTLGIGWLWLLPYIAVSSAKFYDDVKNNFTEGATQPKIPSGEVIPAI